MARCCFVFCEQSSLLDDAPPPKKKNRKFTAINLQKQKKISTIILQKHISMLEIENGLVDNKKKWHLKGHFFVFIFEEFQRETIQRVKLPVTSMILSKNQ